MSTAEGVDVSMEGARKVGNQSRAFRYPSIYRGVPEVGCQREVGDMGIQRSGNSKNHPQKEVRTTVPQGAEMRGGERTWDWAEGAVFIVGGQ